MQHIGIFDTRRVKSGNFGQPVNSDIRLQAVKIQMRRHKNFTVCLVNLNLFQ